MSEISSLRQLANLITQSVDRLEQDMANANLKYPSLDKPMVPFSLEEGASMSPAIRQSAAFIISACAQLIANVEIPFTSLFTIAAGFHASSCLRTAINANVAETLRETPEGLHVDIIAEKNGFESAALSRILRALATHHVFKEVKPNVFANNRLSSMLDTMKSIEEIKADPVNKHSNTTGVTGVLEHTTDDIFKASAYLPEVLSDPVMQSSGNVQHTPFALGHRTNKPFFDWLEEPNNEYRLKRFAAGMGGLSKIEPPYKLSSFKWESLGQGALVVDVGGGRGHLSMQIAREHSHLRFIVQDRPQVIEEAQSFWRQYMPSALERGTVILQAHDFFEPQPQLPADVALFLCRLIFHHYPHATAALLLKNLRAASNSQTKLLLIEQVIPYACRGFSNDSKLGIVAPEPLLGNLGKANAFNYYADCQMHAVSLGEERTLERWEELLRSTGWRIDHIVPGAGGIPQIVAVIA